MILSIIAMFIVTFALISFTLTQFTLSNEIPPLLKQSSDFFLSLVGFDLAKLDEKKYIGLLSALIGSFTVLVTLWFAITTLVSYLKNIKELKDKSLIQKKLIVTDGEDDLRIMNEYYQGADSVIVFAGDFSWIQKNDNLKKEIEKLSKDDKIRFVSYKTENVVKAKIGEQMYEQFKSQFRFVDGHREIKCSFVKSSQSSVFLYKVDKRKSGGENNVCIIPNKENAQYLLETLEKLCDKYAK